MSDMRANMSAVTRSKVFMAPNDAATQTTGKSVFLAGSIDMGEAVNWQEAVTAALLSAFPNGLSIYNPRRDDWDNSWEQDISDPQFSEQVYWEMEHLERADVICYYFDPNGKAPITLMELGLHAASGKAVVCCPPGYWRRGNVQMVCDKYQIVLVDQIEDLIEELKTKILGG